MSKKKVVVAFSGGLDTSYTVMKLAKEGYEVYAACANTGGFSAEQLKTNEEKKTLIKEFLPILVRVNSQIELDTYLRKLEKITGFDIESIRALVRKARMNEGGSGEVAANKEMIENFHPERKALQDSMMTSTERLPISSLSMPLSTIR